MGERVEEAHAATARRIFRASALWRPLAMVRRPHRSPLEQQHRGSRIPITALRMRMMPRHIVTGHRLRHPAPNMELGRVVPELQPRRRQMRYGVVVIRGAVDREPGYVNKMSVQ